MASSDNKSESGDAVLLHSGWRNIINATRSPGMTPRNATCSQPHSPNNTVLLNSLQGVVRTGGVIATDIPVQRRNHRAVNSQNHHTDIAGNQKDECNHRNVAHLTTPFRTSETSDRRVAQLACAAPGSARITTSVPGPSLAIDSWVRALSRRRTRLRFTATPTAFETMKPNRGSDRASACET
jgi:hypothetical protein